MKRWSIITKKDHLRFVHRKELKRKDIGYASPFLQRRTSVYIGELYVYRDGAVWLERQELDLVICIRNSSIHNFLPLIRCLITTYVAKKYL